jgi:hypothetical protein
VIPQARLADNEIHRSTLISPTEIYKREREREKRGKVFLFPKMKPSVGGIDLSALVFRATSRPRAPNLRTYVKVGPFGRSDREGDGRGSSPSRVTIRARLEASNSRLRGRLALDAIFLSREGGREREIFAFRGIRIEPDSVRSRRTLTNDRASRAVFGGSHYSRSREPARKFNFLLFN